MKRKLLLTALCAVSAAAMAQTDVTSTYIVNAGFDTETDFQSSNVATAGSNQRKTVTGWTHSGGNTYTTGAAIGFGTSGQINGANLPSTNADGGTTGGALCLNAAWESSVWYSQNVTLPAGNYILKFKVNNVGKNEGWNKDPALFTFTTDKNTYAGNVGSYPLNEWTEQTVNFSLATETTGTIKIGYKANNTSSGNTPKLVVDYVKALYNSNYTATLQSAIDRATRLYIRTKDSDLNSAITTAQDILDAAGTNVNYQATIDEAVTTLRSAISTAQATVVLEGEEDITYLLENADFESSTAITGGICTYAYDCASNGVFYSQMQQVEGWEAEGNDDGKAAGVLAYGSDTWIANTNYRATSVTSSINESNALALVGAWNGTVQYKQNVTLPAGIYVLTVPVYNSNGGTAITKNLIGFITDNGTEYLAKTTSYPVGSTTKETINFILEEETSGYISLGYTAANTSSGNMPKMFIDAITVKYFTANKSALYDILETAQTYQNVLDDDDLADAISTAQSVYDNGQALQSAVDAQVTALTTAISTALNNIASGTNVTALFVTNNSFESGSTGWDYNSASDTGVKSNDNATFTTEGADGSNLFNTWGGTSAKYVKQSLANLPDGFYLVSALVASDYPNSVTLYAGDGTNDIDVDFAGKSVFISGVSGIGIPSDGALEIGATSTSWYKIDKFQLIYYKTEDEAQTAIDEANLTHAVATYNKALAAAQTISNDDITGKERVDLNAAIAADKDLNKDSKSDVKDATNRLIEVSAAFTKAASDYERAAFAITKATAASVDASALSTLKDNSTTVASDLTEPTNTLLSAVVNSYAPGTLGFANGEYAPYNNVEGLTALAIAGDIASKTITEIDAAITTLANTTWTANNGDVDAIYNGLYATATEGANYPLGWTRTNAWGQMRSEIEGDYATAYYNQPGSLKYGDTGVYTMPLAGYTWYKLTFAYRSNENNSNNGVTASVLNGEDGLAATTFSGNGSTSKWAVATKYFATGAAGNYVLTLANSGNTWMTGVSIVKETPDNIEMISSANLQGYKTFYNAKLNYEVDANTTIYKAAAPAGGYVTLTEMSTDKIIPAGTPVILKTSHTADYKITLTPTATASTNGFEGNVLQVAATEGTINGAYILAYKNGEGNGFGFWQYTGSLDAGDIYLTAGSNAKNRDGDATAIEAIEAANADDDTPLYNLAGQRVGKGYKGIVIKNGAKFINK